MTDISIKRFYDTDCTLGRFVIGNFQGFTLELPWKDNQKNISCIPEGEYEYFFRESPKNGEVLELRNVENRAFIQIHAGNYTSQIHGCILPGDGIKHLNNDHIPDITNSKNTLRNILNRAGQIGTIEIYS